MTKKKQCVVYIAFIIIILIMDISGAQSDFSDVPKAFTKMH